MTSGLRRITDGLITCDDAEMLSKIPASTWRRWIAEGRLTARTVRGRRYIDVRSATRLAELREGRGGLPYRRS